MSKSNIQIPHEYIVSLNMNGLRGRMLKLPPPTSKKGEVLLIYGHHASLERFYSLAQVINDYAGVTMPDLPGFGGMDSFFKIHEKPDIDTMADYLASFIKLRYKSQRFTIAAISYGFTVVTRMLERYPEIVRQVDVLISVVGFTHKDEIRFNKSRYWFYKSLASFFKYKLPAAFFHNVVLHPSVLRTFYSRTHNAKHKFATLDAMGRSELTEFEIQLWRSNEVRTYMVTTLTMLNLDNTKGSVKLPVRHIYVEADNYFDNELVEHNMRLIFTDYIPVPAPIKSHMPNVTAGKDEAATLFPAEICELFKKAS